jgi:hypothetical protein
MIESLIFDNRPGVLIIGAVPDHFAKWKAFSVRKAGLDKNRINL